MPTEWNLDNTATATVDVKDLAKEITLTVYTKRLSRWRWRLKVASWLFRLAAWIMWVNIEIEAEA